MQFGRSSERLNREVEQLELRLEELQTAQAEQAAHTPEAVARAPATARTLPRERVVHAPACTGPDYGKAMRPIGEDVSEVLDYVPELWPAKIDCFGFFRGSACERQLNLA